MLILQPYHGVCPRLRRAPRRSLIAASPSAYRTHFLRSSCPCRAVVRYPSPGACEQRPIRLAPHELRDELSPRREDLGTLGVGGSRSGLGDGEGDASVGRHQPDLEGDGGGRVAESTWPVCVWTGSRRPRAWQGTAPALAWGAWGARGGAVSCWRARSWTDVGTRVALRSVDSASRTQCAFGSTDSGARLLGLESCCAPYWPCNLR